MVKNKVAPPFKTAEFDILYGSGISKSTEIIDLAIQLEVVEKSGAWFYFDGQRLGQGKENAKEFLLNHPEIMEEVENLLRETINNNTSVSKKDDLDGDD